MRNTKKGTFQGKISFSKAYKQLYSMAENQDLKHFAGVHIYTKQSRFSKIVQQQFNSKFTPSQTQLKGKLLCLCSRLQTMPEIFQVYHADLTDMSLSQQTVTFSLKFDLLSFLTFFFQFFVVGQVRLGVCNEKKIEMTTP